MTDRIAIVTRLTPTSAARRVYATDDINNAIAFAEGFHMNNIAIDTRVVFANNNRLVNTQELKDGRLVLVAAGKEWIWSR